MVNNWKLIKFFILIIVIAMGFYYFKSHPVKSPEKTNIPKPETLIINDQKDWAPTDDSFRIPFAKILSIGFSTDKNYLYIRYNLGGKLPEKNAEAPKFNQEKLTGLNFYMSLDENYYDHNGQKNSGGSDAELKMSFYGYDKPDNESGKIEIDGQLVAGGPGYNYFVVRFPYKQVLFNQNGQYIVFSSYSMALTRMHTAGASVYDMKNQALAADPQNPNQIKIKLSPK